MVQVSFSTRAVELKFITSSTFTHLSVFLPPALSADVVDLAVEHLVGAGVDLRVGGLGRKHLLGSRF